MFHVYITSSVIDQLSSVRKWPINNKMCVILVDFRSLATTISLYKNMHSLLADQIIRRDICH